MVFSKRHGAELREAHVTGLIVKFSRFRGVTLRNSSDRKHAGKIPHVSAKLVSSVLTFDDESDAIAAAKLYIK